MKEDLDFFEERSAVVRNYPAILVRRRWYILAPLLLCGLIGSIIAQLWPLLYRSDALILVEQQKVPEQYVMPNIITSLQNRLDAMIQLIESRTRLQALIEQFGLYPHERAKLTIDEVVDRMRKNISVTLVQAAARQGDVTGFRISYSADRARTAQRITNELTSQFIDESMRQRTQQSAGTTMFLQSELDAAQKELGIQEERLREYKLQFIGELPEQEHGNIQLLSSAEAQLYAASAALQRAEQQKTYLEAMRAEYQALAGQFVSTDGAVVTRPDVTKSAAMLQVEANVAEAEKRVSQLRANYRPGWPMLDQAEAVLATWTKRKKELEAEEAAKSVVVTSVIPGSGAVSGSARLNLVEFDSRLKSGNMEIENLRKEGEELKRRIQDLQKRINMTPVREQQLSEITRTYENARAQYQSLLQKKLQSELASNLDKRQQGEQFRIVDPASLPDKPEGRLRIMGMGWFIGLCLGVGLALLRELTGQRVNDDNDVKGITPLPVFSIPVMRTPPEEKKKKLHFALECVGGAFLALVALFASARTYLMS